MSALRAGATTVNVSGEVPRARRLIRKNRQRVGTRSTSRRSTVRRTPEVGCGTEDQLVERLCRADSRTNPRLSRRRSGRRKAAAVGPTNAHTAGFAGRGRHPRGVAGAAVGPAGVECRRRGMVAHGPPLTGTVCSVRCPGRDLALFVASTVLAQLFSTLELSLTSDPDPDPAQPLRVTLNQFGLRFTASPGRRRVRSS